MTTPKPKMAKRWDSKPVINGVRIPDYRVISYTPRHTHLFIRPFTGDSSNPMYNDRLGAQLEWKIHVFITRYIFKWLEFSIVMLVFGGLSCCFHDQIDLQVRTTKKPGVEKSGKWVTVTRVVTFQIVAIFH